MKKREKKNPLKAIDFFCGAGGMTYGLSKSGIKVLAGIDIELNCKKTYEINNPNSKFIHSDIHNLSEEKLAELTGIEKNDDFLIFIGCSPCQYWTKINTHKTKSKETKDLLKEFQRFIKFFKPGYIVIENVPGLLTNEKEKNLERFLTFIKKESYTFDHGIINSNHYGVPQNRKRYLLVGSRVSKEIKLPNGKFNENLNVKNFIGPRNGFRKIRAGHKDPSDFLHSSAKLSEKNIMRIKKTPKNGGNRHSWKDDPKLQINTYRGKDHIFRDVYGRMYWDKPAPTITTRFNSFSNGRFGHPEENRAISLREGATLQTFPKKYRFIGTNEASIAKQIGNAVPPEIAKRIGQKIKENWRNAILPN
jgi:DNA (cytosine-5)-methyltransferase 1